jgi:cytidylate kinase
MDKIIIAIDGPAGAGKSSIAKIIAKKMNIDYVDSGAIYRAIAKKMLDMGMKIDDYTKIEIFLDKLSIELKNGEVFIDNEDISPFLRIKEVTEFVSPVSSNISVRKRVNKFLNEYSKGKSIIMDGRDIGTVVFPDAAYKFYLDASIDVRADRRFLEKNTDMTLNEIKESIKKRDENDKNKPFGALKIASNAIYLDTTNLSIDEVVEYILKTIKYNGVEHE